MPIPASSCPPGTTPDVCCNDFFLIGDRIRTVAFDALLGCMDTSCGDREFRSYSTMGNRIEDVLGESLIITMTSGNTAPITNTPQQRQRPHAVTRLNYRIELRENGWPQSGVAGNQIKVPSAAQINAATAHSIGHAQKMWLALVNGATAKGVVGRMFPISNHHHILSVSVGSLNPIGPQAYQVAWSVDLTVDAMLSSKQPYTGG